MIRACGPATAAAAGGCTSGTNLQEAQAQFGYIGLDRYKDWTVDYAEDKAKAVYPGAFFSPEHIARLKTVLDQHPDAEFLKKWFLFSGQTDDAVRHAQRVIDGLKKPYGENNFFLVGLSNYRKSQFFAFVDLAEDALACRDLPPDLRRELRRLLALYANAFSDPDANPRGAGVHLGNNNMPINRTLALSYFAGLLPDHPRYAYWMQSIQDFVQYKYATEMAVDGVNLECPSYALYSPFRTLNISQNILRNRGFHNFGPDGYHGRFLQWLSQLSMADPRHDGHRIIPGMGNSSNLVENVWGFSMAAQADHDATVRRLAAFHEPAGQRQHAAGKGAQLSRPRGRHAPCPVLPALHPGEPRTADDHLPADLRRRFSPPVQHAQRDRPAAACRHELGPLGHGRPERDPVRQRGSPVPGHRLPVLLRPGDREQRRSITTR